MARTLRHATRQWQPVQCCRTSKSCLKTTNPSWPTRFWVYIYIYTLCHLQWEARTIARPLPKQQQQQPQQQQQQQSKTQYLHKPPHFKRSNMGADNHRLLAQPLRLPCFSREPPMTKVWIAQVYLEADPTSPWKIQTYPALPKIPNLFPIYINLPYL